MSYKGIRMNCFDFEPKIVDIDFEIRDKYIYVIKGGTTGYESGNYKEMINEYIDKSMFTVWVACFGTVQRYSRLEIPMYEVLKYLETNGYLMTFFEYGYLKKVIWLDE
jgi:hypothetical protein